MRSSSNQILGQINGLKPQDLRWAQRITRRRIPPDNIITWELARTIAQFSKKLNQQVGLLIDRKGNIHYLLLGDHRSIFLPDLKAYRSTPTRLNGLRYIHTHLYNEPLNQDDLTDLALLRFDLICAIEVDKTGEVNNFHIAHLLPDNPENKKIEVLPPQKFQHIDIRFKEFIRSLETEFSRKSSKKKIAHKKERALLVSVITSSRNRARESLDELKRLAQSSGIEVVGTFIQKRKNINPKFLLGRGKLSELAIQALQLEVDILIFDQELTPSQMRSITDHLDLKVIDRSQLILDIFAQRAKTREGKIQVEMAQLKYILPKLVTKDDALSRLTGGIGGRGPGETKLEIDRRRVKKRLQNLNRELISIRKQRKLRRRRREKGNLPIISIVGYTNSGKSTLLNSLTNSNVFTEDRLFATLDPTSRRLRFPKDKEAIITDTVGFIRNLPETLLQAFQATLEELEQANLLLHVIDISSHNFWEQMEMVESLINEMGLGDIPILRVLNKRDLLPQEEWRRLSTLLKGIPISAINRETLLPLVNRISEVLFIE